MYRDFSLWSLWQNCLLHQFLNQMTGLSFVRRVVGKHNRFLMV